MSNTTDILNNRAAWETRRGRPYLALSLYWNAWENMASAERASEGARLLHAALDLCLEYLEKDAAETLRVADALIALSSGKDSRALSVRGVWRSLRARQLWQGGKRAEAWEFGQMAEHDLKAALVVSDFDTEAWGSLGGLYKRMAEWSYQIGEEAKAKDYQQRMLDAYHAGAQKGCDAYLLLNYLEYRSVFEKKLPLVRSAVEAEMLDRALRLRRRQFHLNEDMPWAAFDLARGQHYLKSNIPRFLNDLSIAVEDARKTARAASDRWMVETAMKSLRDLYEAGVELEGLEDGLLLVQRAIMDDGWIAGSWGELGRPDDFLSSELRAAQDKLVQIQNIQTRESDMRERLLDYIDRAERKWSEEDEARFQDEIAQFRQDIEPNAKKTLRVLWRIFGNQAVEWALKSGPVPAAAGIIAKYAAHASFSK